jgi:hypothetical protein
MKKRQDGDFMKAVQFALLLALAASLQAARASSKDAAKPCGHQLQNDKRGAAEKALRVVYGAPKKDIERSSSAPEAQATKEKRGL